MLTVPRLPGFSWTLSALQRKSLGFPRSSKASWQGCLPVYSDKQGNCRCWPGRHVGRLILSPVAVGSLWKPSQDLRGLEGAGASLGLLRDGAILLCSNNKLVLSCGGPLHSAVLFPLKAKGIWIRLDSSPFMEEEETKWAAFSLSFLWTSTRAELTFSFYHKGKGLLTL